MQVHFRKNEIQQYIRVYLAGWCYLIIVSIFVFHWLNIALHVQLLLQLSAILNRLTRWQHLHGTTSSTSCDNDKEREKLPKCNEKISKFDGNLKIYRMISWKGHSAVQVIWLMLCPFNNSSDSPIMELYYIVLSLPLCIVLFSHNMLYIPVLLLLNKLSFTFILLFEFNCFWSAAALTKDIDLTITNILEGRVQFSPVAPSVNEPVTVSPAKTTVKSTERTSVSVPFYHDDGSLIQ